MFQDKYKGRGTVITVPRPFFVIREHKKPTLKHLLIPLSPTTNKCGK